MAWPRQTWRQFLGFIMPFMSQATSFSRQAETTQLSPRWSGKIAVVTSALDNIQTPHLTIPGSKGS